MSECVLKTLACRGLRVGPSKCRGYLRKDPDGYGQPIKMGAVFGKPIAKPQGLESEEASSSDL